MRTLILFAVFLCGLLCVRTASAQDTRSVGVTMGYPASVGVLWHFTEAVAIRPELSFDFFSSETETEPRITANTSQDGHTVSVGLSALFYVARWDMTRAYIVPRYAYSDSRSSIEGPFDIVRDSRGHAHDVGVSFGAQHTLGDRFAIYGELGLAYERVTSRITTSELRRTGVNTRSGVGVIVYF